MKFPFSLLFGLGAALAAATPTAPAAPAAPAPTAAAKLTDKTIEGRAESCTFTAASAASASKKSCATIVLDSIAVPSGTTLDLTDLSDGTHVRVFSYCVLVIRINLDRSSSKALRLSATKNG